jgi:hypothetical protein
MIMVGSHLLPLPVLPHTPILSPLAMFSDTPFSTLGRPSAYRACTYNNTNTYDVTKDTQGQYMLVQC